jgi:hypothetical protein
MLSTAAASCEAPPTGDPPQLPAFLGKTGFLIVESISGRNTVGATARTPRWRATLGIALGHVSDAPKQRAS